jgi:hypothetical protein
MITKELTTEEIEQKLRKLSQSWFHCDDVLILEEFFRRHKSLERSQRACCCQDNNVKSEWA